MGFEYQKKTEGKLVDQNDPIAVFEAEIGLIKQESINCNQWEIQRMEELKDLVKKGEKTIEDALEEARGIKNAKNDYH